MAKDTDAAREGGIRISSDPDDLDVDWIYRRFGFEPLAAPERWLERTSTS